MATTPRGVKELRGLGAAELQAQIEQLRQDLWEQRVKAKEGALPQTHLPRVARRQIARIQTILREQAPKPASKGT